MTGTKGIFIHMNQPTPPFSPLKVCLQFLAGLTHRPFTQQAVKGGDKIDLGQASVNIGVNTLLPDIYLHLIGEQTKLCKSEAKELELLFGDIFIQLFCMPFISFLFWRNFEIWAEFSTINALGIRTHPAAPCDLLHPTFHIYFHALPSRATSSSSSLRPTSTGLTPCFRE